MMNRVAKAVIDASKNYSLTVRADFSGNYGIRVITSELVARKTIDLIISNAHRLRDLNFRGPLSYIDLFLNLPAGFANSLEIMTFNVYGNTRGSSPDFSFLI